MNRISFTSNSNNNHNKTIEKKVQKINTMATGIAGLGIVIAATGAAEIAGYAKEEGSTLNKAVKRADKILQDFKKDLLKDKGIKYIAEKVSSLSEKAENVFERISRRIYKVPRTVRIASVVALGILGLDHIYRKGQINGAFTTANIAGQVCKQACKKSYKKGFKDGEAHAKLNDSTTTVIKKDSKC